MNEPDSGSNGLNSLAVLASRGSGRFKKLGTGWILSVLVFRSVRGYYNTLKEKTSFKVKVPANDDVYPDLHRWLLDLLPEEKRRALRIMTKRPTTGNNVYAESPGDSSDRIETAELHHFFDGDTEQVVEMDGHRIRVTVERPQWANRSNDEELMRLASREETIVFSCSSLEARTAVLDLIQRIADDRLKNRTASDLWIADRWGGWQKKRDLAGRPISTVVLKDEIVDELSADLERFFDAEETYSNLGLPWHRGYLFHGPPGSGKTSFARAIATKFEMDIYWVALSDLKGDTDLVGLISSVEARSMLLLEDIDVLHASGSRDDAEAEGITLSGLLNALDGVVTPHGLVTVMTTNDISTLDEALIRPGRADAKIELGYVDQDQFDRLVENFVGGEPIELHRDDLVPAYIVEIIKEHFDNPDACRKALTELADGRRFAEAR